MSVISTANAALLRPQLLEGVAVLLVPPGGGGDGGGFAVAVGEVCAALGAAVASCTQRPDSLAVGRRTGEPAIESELDGAVTAAVARLGALDMLAVDGAAMFATGRARGGTGHDALRACMDGAWNATRATVNHAFLRAGEPRGRIVYIAPSPDAGECADAARSGLENLARTLSIEWARHHITTVAIAPGVRTGASEVAALVAYLASPAGAYFSGCQLDLRGV